MIAFEDDAFQQILSIQKAIKVFINGAWVGITEDPLTLYNDMKDKKYKGIINIYTSIIFDYKYLEIRICNDGGRLTRPVLKVRDNKALITKEIIDKLSNKELVWNDLITSCTLDESVIEYIDPEEQNFSMIAMKCKDKFMKKTVHEGYFKYTHCEIHPSTIFGVLASCIPFPDHNQALEIHINVLWVNRRWEYMQRIMIIEWIRLHMC